MKVYQQIDLFQAAPDVADKQPGKYFPVCYAKGIRTAIRNHFGTLCTLQVPFSTRITPRMML